MNKILIIGSASVDETLYVKDFPLPGETIHALDSIKAIGGKGANQAVAISRAGAIASFMFASGKDDDAKLIIDALNKTNLSLINKTANCNSGKALIVVNSKSENKIVINAGANAYMDEQFVNDDLSLFDDVAYVVLQNEIPQSTNEYIINLAKKRGIKIVYNPAPYREIDLKTLDGIDYLIPNENELRLLCNRSNDDYEKMGSTLLDYGVKNVVVTLGEKGAICLNKSICQHIPAFKVNAIDTVAAGDTFVGFFVALIASGFSFIDAATHSSKAASICVTKRGAMPSIPFRKDLGF